MPLDEQKLKHSNRTPRADAVLSYLAGSNGSLFYEAWMLSESAKIWANTPAGLDHNFATECFLIHYRNIRNFFYPPADSWTNRTYFDDVIAFDFSTEWKYVATDWKECSPDERTRIDKLLAHISYSRPALDHGWPVDSMTAAIRRAFAEFVAVLPANRKEWFKGYGV